MNREANPALEASAGRTANPLCDVEKLAEKVREMGVVAERLMRETESFRRVASESRPLTTLEWGSWRGALGGLRAAHETLRDFRGAKATFHAVLQQYHLPTKLRREVEDGAKFFSRERKLSPRTPASTKEMIEDLARYQRALVRAMAEGTPSGACAAEAGRFLQAGPLRLVNTGGFDVATMQMVQGIVTEAAERLHAIGLDGVLYGDVYVSNQISGARVAAFYYGKSDEFFVRADKKILAEREHVVKTVCHELAHRFDQMFLRFGSAVPSELWKIYRAVEVAERNCAPVPGEKYVWGGEFIVEGWKMGLPGLGIVALKHPDGRSAGTVSLDTYCKVLKKGFVTNYARRGGPDENFAEMVAEDAMGRLPDWQVALLEPVMAKGIARADEKAAAAALTRLPNPAGSAGVVSEERVRACRKVNQGTHWIREDRRHAVYHRDHYTCVYCGYKDQSRTGHMMSLDHLIPCEHGGSNDNDNIATCCGSCNSTKGAMTKRAFYAYLVEVKKKTREFAQEIQAEIRRRVARRIDRDEGKLLAERAHLHRQAARKEART